MAPNKGNLGILMTWVISKWRPDEWECLDIPRLKEYKCLVVILDECFD